MFLIVYKETESIFVVLIFHKEGDGKQRVKLSKKAPWWGNNENKAEKHGSTVRKPGVTQY